MITRQDGAGFRPNCRGYGVQQAGANNMSERISIESAQLQALSDKVQVLTHWLADHSPHCETSQKHLEERSVEQAYWHYGYVCALRDVISMISRRSAE